MAEESGYEGSCGAGTRRVDATGVGKWRGESSEGMKYTVYYCSGGGRVARGTSERVGG